jgi:cell division protein FtsZ
VASNGQYAPPAPRQPETARREYGYDTTPEPARPQASQPAPPPVTERPAPTYTQPVDVADLDDDVDVPPFMKR